MKNKKYRKIKSEDLTKVIEGFRRKLFGFGNAITTDTRVEIDKIEHIENDILKEERHIIYFTVVPVRKIYYTDIIGLQRMRRLLEGAVFARIKDMLIDCDKQELRIAIEVYPPQGE